MADKSREYWINRSLRNEERSNYEAVDILQRAKKHYEKAAKAIDDQIAAFYGRYASEQGLSYAEAVKKLNSKEARQWRKSLEAYVDEINSLPDGDMKDRLKAELDARAYASRITRLDALKSQIDMEIDRLMYNTENDLANGLTGIYSHEYYRKMFDIQQRAGRMFDFAHLDAEMVEAVLRYPWSGADFSSRLWENKRSLLFRLRETLTQSLIQGQSVTMTSKALAEKLGSSYSAAENLIRTESSRIHNDADKGAYQAAGISEYEFMATLSERTCKICGDLDGKTFPVEEAQTGVNFPPMHPRCRCTTVEHDPDEWKDWEAVGQPMPKRMTYEEWYAEQVEKKDPGSVELARKKEYNFSTDIRQLEKYSERLGDEAPKSLAAFQRLKYERPDEWAETKGFYAYKGRVPEASRNDYLAREAVKAVGVNGFVRVPPQPVNAKELHFKDKHGENHGCTEADAIHYIENARCSVTRKRWDGSHTNYYDFEGAAYIDDESGAINTAFSNKDFDDKTKAILEVFK